MVGPANTSVLPEVSETVGAFPEDLLEDTLVKPKDCRTDDRALLTKL